MKNSIFAHPITLRQMEFNTSKKYLNAYFGRNSHKNEKEIEHFKNKFSPITRNSYKSRLKLKIDIPQHGTVLDIGCGPYDSLADFPGEKFYLDDIIDFYIDKLNVNYNGTAIHAKTEVMPFISDSFDTIFSVNMIDHVDDMPETIAEIHRVLKKTGKVYMQSYFNSHQLLETEPGVFDEYFLDNFINNYFTIEDIKTYAVGDPNISKSYNMDTIFLTLIKKDVIIPRKNRYLYENEHYFGPQSCISYALKFLKNGDSDSAGMFIENISSEPFYEIHYNLLTAFKFIVDGEFGKANIELKNLLSNDRIRRNALCRLAVMELQNKRIALSIKEKQYS